MCLIYFETNCTNGKTFIRNGYDVRLFRDTAQRSRSPCVMTVPGRRRHERILQVALQILSRHSWSGFPDPTLASLTSYAVTLLPILSNGDSIIGLIYYRYEYRDRQDSGSLDWTHSRALLPCRRRRPPPLSVLHHDWGRLHTPPTPPSSLAGRSVSC